MKQRTSTALQALFGFLFAVTLLSACADPCGQEDADFVSKQRYEGTWLADFDQDDLEFLRYCYELTDLRITTVERVDNAARILFVADGVEYRAWIGRIGSARNTPVETLWEILWYADAVIEFQDRPEFLTEDAYPGFIGANLEYCVGTEQRDRLHLFFGSEPSWGSSFPYRRR